MFRLVQKLFSPSDEGMSSNSGRPESESGPGPEPFYPSLHDVFKLRYLLRWKVVPGGLPTEMVDLIIDAAEYWPSTVTSMAQATRIRKDRDQELVRTWPLCFDEKVLPAHLLL